MEQHLRIRVILELFGKGTINKINETELRKAIGIDNIQHQERNYWHITEEKIPTDDDIKPSNIEILLGRVVKSKIYEMGLRVVDILPTLFAPYPSN